MRYIVAGAVSALLLVCPLSTLSLRGEMVQAQTVQNDKAEGDRLLKQGDEQLEAKNPQAALKLYEQSLTSYQKINDRRGEGQAYRGLGKAARELKQFDKALAYHQKTLEIAREIRDRELELRAFANFVLSYSALENNVKVIEFAQPMLTLSRELKKRQEEGYALAFLADSYADLSEHQKAIEAGQQALVIGRELKNLFVEALALDALTRAFWLLGNPQKVVEFGQQSLAIAQQNKNQVFEARALAFLADAYARTSQNQEAIKVGQQALVIVREIQNTTQNIAVEYIALYALATAYKDLEEYDQSIKFAQRSLVIAQKSGNLAFEGSSLDFLGGLYGELEGRDREAEFAIQQGLAIARKTPDYGLEIKLLTTASKNAQLNDDYKKAIELAKQSLALAQKHKIYTSDIAPVVQLFDLYSDLAAYREMAGLAQQLLKFGTETDNSLFTAIGWMYLAWAQFGQGQQSEALASSQQFMAVAKATKNPLLKAVSVAFLGLGYGNTGNYEQSLILFQQGLSIMRELGDSNAESGFLELQGSIYYKNRQFKQAIEAYRAALEIDKESSSAESGLARVYRDMGMPITAITYYKQAIRKMEIVRRKIRDLSSDLQNSALQTIVGVGNMRAVDSYRELADLLLLQGRILEAQQVLELLKVQEIKDFDRTTRAKIDNGKVELDSTERTIVDKYGGFIAFGQKLRECQESKPQCADYDRLLTLRTQAQAEYDRAVNTFETAVKTRRQEDENNFLNPKNRFSGKVQEILEAQPNTVLIYSLVTDDKLWLVLASKGETLRQFEVKVSQAELNSAVVKFRQLMEQCERQSCGTRDTAELNTVSQQLYGWLFPKPLQQELQGKIKHLIFAPDRITRYIPMSALFDGKQYLIENYTVSTIVSAEYTNTDRPNYDPKQATVLAVGLSNAAPPDFPPLRNVPLELSAIVQTDATRSGIYRGLELLNQKFDLFSLQKHLSGHTILHIATHGAFVREQADASYILLGTGQKLPISEIKGLNDLGKIQLVVLSACQTALADRGANGVEIANLSFSFMERGVKAVIASLWQVNDSSTSLLMQQFYKNLASGRFTKAEALQQAQLSLLQPKVTAQDAPNRSPSLMPKGVPQVRSNPNADFSHPYYWAPFILIGNSL